MAPTTRLYPKTLSLTALADAIANDEALIGPLTALGHTATKTAATFSPDLAPSKPAMLVLVPGGGAGSPPAGTTAVCSGAVWVASAPAQVLAYR